MAQRMLLFPGTCSHMSGMDTVSREVPSKASLDAP
jgi:hypothetical protein